MNNFTRKVFLKKLTILTDVFDKFLARVFLFSCNEKKITSCTSWAERGAREKNSGNSHFLLFVPIQISTRFSHVQNYDMSASEWDEENSTVKWHWSRHTPKKKVIILVHHTRAIEQTLCNIPPTFAVVWHHLTTGMPSQLNMNGEREMITNYFDISFCSSLSRRFFFTSTAFSCVQFYGISESASWCNWDVVDIMSEPDVVHFATSQEHKITLLSNFLNTLRLSPKVEYNISRFRRSLFSLTLRHCRNFSCVLN